MTEKPLEALKQKIVNLEIDHRELSGVIWGDDKTRSNGIRARVAENELRLDKIEPIALDAQKKIHEHIEEHEKMDEITQTLKTAAMQVRGAVIASSISALAAVIVAIISAVTR